MKKVFFIIFLIIISISCTEKPINVNIIEVNEQNEIIEEYLKNGAWNYHFLEKEWDEWINKGLQKDSTIAYLWQQKALPFWKQRKYSLAISFYDKAVKFDKQQWLSRLGFLKCIFAKDYHAALIDFTEYIREFGSTYEQDHSLEFYMGICYLQLGEYENALFVFSETIDDKVSEYGEDWVHYLDRFYLAITYYELGKYDNSIAEFDKVLKQYPGFSDVQFYKSLCLKKIGKLVEAKIVMEKGRKNYTNGRTFNEDSSKYEDYPYQVVWQWDFINSIL